MTAGTCDERSKAVHDAGRCCGDDTAEVSSLRTSALTLALDFGMDSTYEDLRASECTSCLATDDKSAYW